ncbi:MULTISPECIES: hypothetical protein [Streptomyces]|uniref:hypothetical protein n=1 Tax=Streptomyces TaxID=1883 RepID=UPI002E286844|nr:hypothetical protein [[Kitasatospora] papulosa]
MTIAQTLEKPIRALGGTWDTQRAVTALRDAGHQRQQEKRARNALRNLAAVGVLTKTELDSATYQLTIPATDEQ